LTCAFPRPSANAHVGSCLVAVCAFAFASCGEQRTVTARGIAFEPTIVGCSVAPGQCTSANAVLLRESREAHSHRCPADKPYVLVKLDGVLVCMVTLPSAGPTSRGRPIPSTVEARGPAAVASFRAGEVVTLRTGCLACHRLAEAGNRGPGSNLTRVGSELSPTAINRALVDSSAPMPAFSRLPKSERRNLVYFLSQLR
jgi:hypothetical protein